MLGIKSVTTILVAFPLALLVTLMMKVTSSHTVILPVTLAILVIVRLIGTTSKNTEALLLV